MTPERFPSPTPEPSLERQATRARVLVVRGGTVETREDRLAGEEPMAIRVAGPGQDPIDVAITMHTPGDEADLAVGFLCSEGLVRDPKEIVAIEHGDPASHAVPDDEVLVRLSRHFDPALVAERNFVATASCGICGKASLDQLEVRSAPIPDGPVIDAATLLSLPDTLRAAQRAFAVTGGIHAAGLFDVDGTLLLAREDIGRHNALDKLIGAAFRGGELPLHSRVLLLSSRTGFELVQKAAVAGIPIMAAVSAPSDLAVEAAERLGVTLVGFLRKDGFNVYARPDRVAVGRA
jgi:FdhD protein